MSTNYPILGKRTGGVFFDHPLNEGLKANYEASETERKRLIEKMADYEDLMSQESRKTEDIKIDIDAIKESLKSASLFEKIFLYLQIAELQKQLQETYDEIKITHDSWRKTQDEWVVAHNIVAQMENDAELSERDLETLTIELKIANSHYFDEKITAFCASQKVSVKPIYEFPNTPEIKKPRRVTLQPVRQ